MRIASVGTLSGHLRPLCSRDNHVMKYESKDSRANPGDEASYHCSSVGCSARYNLTNGYFMLIGMPDHANAVDEPGVDGELADRRALALSGIVGHASSYPEAIRNLPATLAAATIVQAAAPEAIWVNFTNPVSVLCEAIATRTALTCIGICHHAFSLRRDFAALLQVPEPSVRVEYRGLNHVGWVTDVQVDGASHMQSLTQRLVELRVKKYNYEVIGALGVIPIQHAYSLYRKGEVFYVRQKGLRGSIGDALLKYAGWAGRQSGRARPDSPGHAIAEHKHRVLAALAAKAPWYRDCIVPFLSGLATEQACEQIVTWKHGDLVAGVPGRTAETTVLTEGVQVTPVRFATELPETAQAWLRQVRESERLLIRAVCERSRTVALESLAIHPNVASVSHAQRFLGRYAWPGTEVV